MTDEETFVSIVSAKKRKLSTLIDDCPSASSSSSEGSSNYDDDDVAKTRNQNVALLFPNSCLSPQESVFSIDHILESIFMKLDRQTLFNCRRVSHRWAYFGSKELQKADVSIKFVKSTHFQQRIFRFSSDWTRSIEDLTILMNNSTEFPCTSFDFRSDDNELSFQAQDESSTNMETAQSFFNAHGASFKKIIFRHDLHTEDLKHLLLNQAPNLQHLYLGPIELYSKSCIWSDEGLFDETSSKPKPILKSLKVFKCHFSADLPSIFVQQILECSPNLVEVALPCNYLHFLVQPTNRVQLLKKLKIDLSWFNIESLETFANHVEDNAVADEGLAVRELYFVGGDFREDELEQDDEQDFDAGFNEGVVNVVSRILKACSATCQKLVWIPEGSIKNSNLVIPQMPQVKDLTIEYYSANDEGTHHLPIPINGLSDGVSLGGTFPSLVSLEVRANKVDMKNGPIANIFSDGEEDPAPTHNVQTVTLRLGHHHGKKLGQRFQEMFPNASIRREGRVDRRFDGYDDEESQDD